MEVEATVEVEVDALGEAIFTEIGFPRLSISFVNISILRVRFMFNISL